MKIKGKVEAKDFVINEKNGNEWQQIIGTQLYSLGGPFDGKLWAGGASGKIYYSTDGENWTQSTDTGSAGGYMNMIVYGGKLFAGMSDGTLFMTSGNNHWELNTNFGNERAWRSAVWRNKLYVGGYNAQSAQTASIFVSSGNNYWEIDTSFDNNVQMVRSVCVYNDKLYCGTHPSGTIYVKSSSEVGAGWE